MSHNSKNYSDQGGDKLVIGGELELKEGARIIGLDAGVSVEANPASTGITNLEKIKIGDTTYKIPTITVDTGLNSQSDNPVSNRRVCAELDKKQNKLTSGTNIKTINGESVLGSGNIEVSGGTSEGTKYYQHIVKASYHTFQFICSYATAFTTETLACWLRDKGLTSKTKFLLVNKQMSYTESPAAGFSYINLPNAGIYYNGTTERLGYTYPNIKFYGNVAQGSGDITEITKINIDDPVGMGDLTVYSDTVIEL